jgi:hypothetical protein
MTRRCLDNLIYRFWKAELFSVRPHLGFFTRFIIVENHTGVDLTVIVTVTNNYRVTVEDDTQATLSAGVQSISLSYGRKLVTTNANPENPQELYVGYKRGTKQAIALIQPQAYMTVLANLRNGRGQFVIVKNVVVTKGYLYKFRGDDYDAALAMYQSSLG